MEYAPDELGGEIIEQGAERRLEAWRMVKALRRKSGLEAAELVWDFAETLEGALQTAKKSKHERSEKQAKFAARWLANDLARAARQNSAI